MAGLLYLFGEPCKSMWNSPVELLSGLLPKTNNSHFEFLVLNLLNFFSILISFNSVAMEEEELEAPEICVVGNETTWKMDLPENHG